MLCIGFCIHNCMGLLLQNTFTANQLSQAKIICIITVFNISAFVVSSFFDSYIVGFEKFAVSKFFTLLKVILKPALALTVLTIFRNAVMLAIIDLACVCLVLLLEIVVFSSFIYVSVSAIWTRALLR